MTKTELRNLIRTEKRAMDPEDIRRKSQLLTERFLDTPQYRNAGTVYGYLGYNQEVRTLPLLEQALRDGKRVALPKCIGDEMRFIFINDLNAVSKSGVPEPLSDEPVADDEAALVLMPGLAFDRHGNRLGYGRGYYDRFLAKEPHHPTLALCFDFQVVEQVPTGEYDIPVDLVLWA